ncbi:MAG: HAD hydrolase-like protein [Planctomycetes bacterium]|nr:HAD hydrolase-like protein [Planctomycetota bacterium]
MHERDYQRRYSPDQPTQFLPGSSIEIIREVRLERPPEHALFDFDGTLSLIRQGWPEVMIPMMVEILKETGTDETEAELTELVTNFVMELNGKQTIYQMIRLAEEVKRRGGSPEDPLVYKKWYHDRLMQRIAHRREGLRSGRLSREEMLVPGALAALQTLKDKGVRLYLASGTDEVYVHEEAALLGLDAYFGEHIYGAVDDYKRFSKQMVIEHILQANRVSGDLLIGFGDGYVEIDNVKSAGGTAVAVASDEAHRSGRPDPWKRDRLIGIGADIVIPDFQEFDRLVNYIWEGR